MSNGARATLGVLTLACGVFAAGPQAPTSAQTPPPKSPVPLALPIGCENPPVPEFPCEIYRCVNGIWVAGTKAAGTACDDGNACTYGETCTAAGACVGTSVAAYCASICRTCNGTATCSATPASTGSACSAVPGFDTGCGCTAAGTCVVKTPVSGAQAVTGLCWDSRGNMTAKYVAPPGAVCKVSCPATP